MTKPITRQAQEHRHKKLGHINVRGYVRPQDEGKVRKLFDAAHGVVAEKYEPKGGKNNA